MKTKEEIAEVTGIDLETLEHFLEQMVEDGEITSGFAWKDGRTQIVYSITGKGQNFLDSTGKVLN
jgi:predicted transcriptional regulator